MTPWAEGRRCWPWRTPGTSGACRTRWVSHAFSHPGQTLRTDRLADYWGEALGGPAAYTGESDDHSQVLRIHAGNGEHREMDDRAQACFAAALVDAGVHDDGLQGSLRDYFRWVTTEMASYPDSPEDVPAGLAVPRWTWEGPVT